MSLNIDALSTFIDSMTDKLSLYQALSNPKKSQALTEFVKDVVRDETTSLMREHNEVIQMQREENSLLNKELTRLQAERITLINSHAADLKGLHASHADELYRLHGEYALKLRNNMIEPTLSDT